jgi:cytoskeletal protein RodZ
MLRERREAMGVTLAEVEVATRIRQKYLSALEAEEWHLLPGEVVGRGFLRNYADYLGLDGQEVMDQRRATTDVNLTSALSTTSAGSGLPPEREVDYRPKEVDLKDEGDGIQRGEIRLTPILAIVGVALVVGLVWWGALALRAPIMEAFSGMTAEVAGLFDQPEPTPTAEAMAVVNADNLDGDAAATGTANVEAVDGTGNDGAGGTSDGVVILGSGGSGAANPAPAAPAASAPATGNPAGAAPATDPLAALVPTETPAAVAAAPTPAAPTPEPPAPEAPTPTPVPPTPTLEPPTPEPPTPEIPTPTPEPTQPPAPEAPVVAAAACGDARSVISSPGVGQVVSGVAGVTGNATHEAFQYYKLEYAPGANAGGGYVYFDGSNVQISGGVLGNLNSQALPNGDYTIRLTVVDQSGNFPPPCDVSIVIQN